MGISFSHLETMSVSDAPVLPPVIVQATLTVAIAVLAEASLAFLGLGQPPPAPSWGKAEAYVWLGQVLQKQNRIEEARTAYNNALSVQRDYPWVTKSLLPSLDRK